MGTLGENLRAARVAAKLTQEDLAEKLGTTKSAISRYEQGKREPALAQIAKIAAVLHVRMESLLEPEIFESPEEFDEEWKRRTSQMQSGGEEVTVIHKAGGEVQIIDSQKEQLLSTYEMLDSEDRRSLVRHGELLASQPKYRDTDSAGEE